MKPIRILCLAVPLFCLVTLGACTTPQNHFTAAKSEREAEFAAQGLDLKPGDKADIVETRCSTRKASRNRRCWSDPVASAVVTAVDADKITVTTKDAKSLTPNMQIRPFYPANQAD